MTYESDCFADEIGIDFPSVDHLVARERRAFLAGDSKAEDVNTLTRQLSLSSEDASRGAVVPLELLLRETCERCGGRGETWAERCAACDGSGDSVVPRWLSVVVPPGVADGTRLHFRVSAPREASVRVQVRVAITA